MFARTLDLSKVDLRGLELLVEQSFEGQWRVAGLALPVNEAAPAPTPADGPRWGLRLDRLTLGEFASAEPQRPTDLRLDGSIDGASLHLAGQVAALGEPLRVEFDYRLGSLALARYGRWLGAPSLAGSLSPQGRLSARVDPDGRAELVQQGAVQADGLAAELAGARATASRIELESALNLSRDGNGLEVAAQRLLLQVRELEAAAGAGQMASDSLDWTGRLAVQTDQDALSVDS